MPRFAILRRGQIIEAFTVDAEICLIGRLPEADIQLASPAVSRRHARIKRTGETWLLEDFASLNGLTVGGKKVSNHALQPGDRITVEDYTIVFEPTDDVYAAGHAATRGISEENPTLERTSLNLKRPSGDLRPS